MKRKYKKFEDLQVGDLIKVGCQHPGCKRYLSMEVVYPSTMQLYCPRYKNTFDMRNQVWHCHQHRNITIVTDDYVEMIKYFRGVQIAK